eukprot:GHVP01050342.1.p1 GENE.GHVP01050342.1~~GHVP01050342.1.p1  ORF type:complete len:221 (+),score=3.06 GHVP01050342.1:148-810(+)
MKSKRECLVGGIIISINKTNSTIIGKCLICNFNTISIYTYYCNTCRKYINRNHILFLYNPCVNIKIDNYLINGLFNNYLNILFKSNLCNIQDMNNNLYVKWENNTTCNHILNNDMRCRCKNGNRDRAMSTGKDREDMSTDRDIHGINTSPTDTRTNIQLHKGSKCLYCFMDYIMDRTEDILKGVYCLVSMDMEHKLHIADGGKLKENWKKLEWFPSRNDD